MGEDAAFRLPDLGEGLTDAEILRWLVAVGDVVEVNQPLVEVETAKAAVEIPSPVAGTVASLGAAEGQVLAVGEPLVTWAGDDREQVLVGYGPRESEPRRRRRLPIGPPRLTSPAPPHAAAPPTSRTPPVPTQTPGGRILAKPPVRKLARDLGIDLHDLRGSGPGGLVTRADVERSLNRLASSAAPAAAVPDPATGPNGRRIPVRGVRRATAEAMVRSAAVPQAVVALTVDVSEAVRLRERLAAASPDSTRPTLLSLVARAVVLALARRPLLHARWHEETLEIEIPASVSLGIAVAGSRGLLVPKIRDAEQRSVPELAAEIEQLAAAARDGSISPGELLDGTFTISNVGVFGVDSGTALLPPGETAILCVGAVQQRPWVEAGALAVRELVVLTLTFDHRVLDGEEAAGFLADVGTLLHDPALMLGRP